MKRLFILFIVIYPVYFAHAQEKLIIKGVVFQTDTNTLLDSVQISIYSRRVTVYSNKFGLFNILAVRGDTVEFSLKDYKTKTLVIKDTSALLVKLNRIVLKQVVIKGSSNRNDLIETEKNYRRMDVSDAQKASILQPLSFLYRIFSRQAKDERKFKKQAEEQLVFAKINNRFTTAIVKANTPLSNSEEIFNFRMQYWPTLEEIKQWSDYDIGVYVKKCYENYKINGDIFGNHKSSGH